jgi:hypothetical protein
MMPWLCWMMLRSVNTMTILTPTNNSQVSADGVPDEALLNRMASEFFALVPGAAQAAAQFLPGLSHLNEPQPAPVSPAGKHLLSSRKAVRLHMFRHWQSRASRKVYPRSMRRPCHTTVVAALHRPGLRLVGQVRRIIF